MLAYIRVIEMLRFLVHVYINKRVISFCYCAHLVLYPQKLNSPWHYVKGLISNTKTTGWFLFFSLFFVFLCLISTQIKHVVAGWSENKLEVWNKIATESCLMSGTYELWKRFQNIIVFYTLLEGWKFRKIRVFSEEKCFFHCSSFFICNYLTVVQYSTGKKGTL